MLTKVEAGNAKGDLLEFTMFDDETGYVVKEIEGLDPVAATISSSDYAQQAGGVYQSSHREKRNIVIHLGLDPDFSSETVQQLRKGLYPYFMPGQEVSLKFTNDDGLVASISGRVESCEAPLFVKEPSVDISVICFDPDFIDPESTTESGVSTDGTDGVSLTYSGSVPTGVVFTIEIDRTTSAFTIYHQSPDGTLNSLDLEADLIAGDVVTISTVTGDKYVTLLRDSVATSILYAVPAQTSWITLEPGDNTIYLYSSDTGDLGYSYSFEYKQRYGGL